MFKRTHFCQDHIYVIIMHEGVNMNAVRNYYEYGKMSLQQWIKITLFLVMVLLFLHLLLVITLFSHHYYRATFHQRKTSPLCQISSNLAAARYIVKFVRWPEIWEWLRNFCSEACLSHFGAVQQFWTLFRGFEILRDSRKRANHPFVKRIPANIVTDEHNIII